MREITIDVVQLRGDYFTIGYNQGKRLKETPLYSWFLSNHLLHSDESLDLLLVKQLFQQYSNGLWEELEGLAEALTLPMSTVVANYSGFNAPFPAMGCSALIKDDFYARNYDFHPDIYDGRLLFIQPENGYASLGFSEHILGRLDGMNEKGLCIGLHLVNQNHNQNGFLATTVIRLVLDTCATIQEALMLLRDIPHRCAINFSLLDATGQSAIVEASPAQIIVRDAEARACSNHFQSPQFVQANRENVTGSVFRLTFLENLSEKSTTSDEAYHFFNDTNSPLFLKNYQQYFGTLHTILLMPKELRAIIGIGGNAQPVMISFEKWLQGEYFRSRLSGTIDC